MGKFNPSRTILPSDFTVAGATPTVTVGDAGEEDTMIVFDGADVDFRLGVDDGTDSLEFGLGTAHGTNTALTFANDGDATFGYGLSVGSARHVVAQDVTVTSAHNGDNTVISQLSGVVIPSGSLILRTVAGVKTATNLSTHLCNIQISATNGTAADSPVSSGTEILGAGMDADAEDAYSTVNSDGDTKEDINLKHSKDVYMSEGIVKVAADSYVYVANAGTGNGTTNASAAVLSVVVEYIGID